MSQEKMTLDKNDLGRVDLMIVDACIDLEKSIPGKGMQLIIEHDRACLERFGRSDNLTAYVKAHLAALP